MVSPIYLLLDESLHSSIDARKNCASCKICLISLRTLLEMLWASFLKFPEEIIGQIDLRNELSASVNGLSDVKR